MQENCAKNLMCDFGPLNPLYCFSHLDFMVSFFPAETGIGLNLFLNFEQKAMSCSNKKECNSLT